MTSAHAIEIASGTTGFTLPGIILLPGCNASSSISDNPVKGPLFIQRRSLEIFITTKARFFNALDNSAELSWELRPWKKFAVGFTLNPEVFSKAWQKAFGKFLCELTPVPMAVPPWGNCNILWLALTREVLQLLSCADQPESSCENSIGIASIKWVLPVLIVPCKLFAFLSISEISKSRPGRRYSSIS